jgi:hypothetical protein
MPADLLARQHSVCGVCVDLNDDAATFDVLEKAFDYRGDVTLTLRDGRTVAGYLFDRRKGKTPADSSIRLMGAASDEKITVHYAEIKHVAFSDRDPAAGKSFETWVKKYVEKKLAGERASIESETLD